MITTKTVKLDITQQSKPFPKLMEYNGSIILAIGYNNEQDTLIGTKLSCSGKNKEEIGLYSTIWTIDFKDFNESILLTND